MRSERSNPPQRGFTLLEVLVALAIIGLGLMAVFGQLNQAVSTAGIVRDKTLANWIALDRITELRINGAFPEVDDSDGEFEMAGQDWRYTIAVAQTQVENLRRIDVRVSLEQKPEQILGRATGFIGRPAAEGGAPPTGVPTGGPPDSGIPVSGASPVTDGQVE